MLMTLTSAPLASSARTTSGRHFLEASISAVAPSLSLAFNVRPVGEQCLHHLQHVVGASPRYGPHQRGHAVVNRGINVRPVGEQRLHHLAVTI
jgi:hypothetical protein